MATPMATVGKGRSNEGTETESALLGPLAVSAISGE